VLVAAVSAVFVALSAGLWTATYGLKEANTALDNFAIAANIKKLDDLEQRAVDLWPMLPHRTTEMERWLAEARILVKQQGVLDQVLQRLEAGSQEVHDPRSLEEILTTDEREQYERLLLTRELLMAAERTAGSQPEPLEWVLSKIGTVEESARRPLRRFQEESDGWLYEHVVPFKERLAAFAAPVTGTIADVEQRLYQARSIASKTTGSYQGQWLEATEAIRKDVRFGDWTLSPQIGLIPLGADPESGFWEFWHLQSGERPERCEETGRWHVRRETGIVLVLLPGGTFRMEAEHFDEQITNGDAPEAAGPWSLRIDPFFLSKYEMTFGQWHRVTGENPSDFDPDVAVAADGWIHPVERVSWSHSRATLRRIHLVLPTEAQWEYAARAGTRTPWWCGAEPTSIHDERAGNVWDEGSAKARPRLDYGVPEPWSDGHVTHSPVGSFEPNRFGLHDVVGNLWEWCRDRHMPYQGAFVWRSKDGEILAAEEPEDDHRMYRGGSFINTARSAAASFRNHNTPDFRNHYVGLRPACVVDP
jgi:formylglycine-generating enzyme required for sulfatase activity